MNSISKKMKKFLEDELMSLAKQKLSARKQDEKKVSFVSKVAKTESSPKMAQAIEKKLISLLSLLLKLPESKIDVQENVANYGMDSLVITKFIKRVSDTYEIKLQATIFFEARNLSRLATILSSRYKSQVEKIHGKPMMKEELPEVPKVEIQEPDQQEEDLLRKYRSIFSSNTSSKEETENKPNLNFQESNQEYEPIAIIGIDGMFAKSDSPEALWNNLKNEVDCIQEIPADRWDWKAVNGDPKKENKTNVKWGGFIPEIDKFDANFFNISPKEAELMDPQHRLFMQSVWKSIYRSGYSTESLSNKKVGVFLGINLQDYQLKFRNHELDAMSLTASHHVFCPSRIAFLLNITGPCHVIDTACSSSLVAIHRAAMAIQNEGCEMAIAGAANVMMEPMMHVQYAKTGMICQDGRCKSFSDSANGYVRGDGVGSVLLKKLSAAERDNDNIIGIIRGSAENHGGTSASLTAPNPNAQAELIKEAVLKSGVDPRTIGYIESHGTGTSLGDPIEINGIKSAFNELFDAYKIENPPHAYCKIGSVKSNIGHAETAAGMAGLIKVLYGMKNKFIPKSLHSETINPLIDLNNTPFSIAQKGTEWQNIELDGKTYPKTAGLSSFGAGGANAHLIVEAYEKQIEQSNDTGEVVIPLSAKSADSLERNVKALFKYITGAKEKNGHSLSTYLQTELLSWFSNQLKIDADEIDIEASFDELNIQRYDLVALSVFLSEKWNINELESTITAEDSIVNLINNLSLNFKSELNLFYGVAQVQQKVRLDIDLNNLAFTLQKGRDEFNYRLAFTVSSLLDLKEQLGAYLNGKSSEMYFSGNTRKEKIDFLLEGQAGKSYIESAIQHKELKALAQLWTKGIKIDWLLLASSNARRIELPSYQFEEKRFWFEEIKTQNVVETSLLTPLLHQNTSDFNAQKFQSTFNGSEDFLVDHKVQEIKTLPGVAYIELARSGGEVALSKTVTGLRDIVWLSPIQVTDQAAEITSRFILDKEDVKYEIASVSNGKNQIHSQGKLITEPLSAAPKINLEELKMNYSQLVEQATAYQEFKQRGLNYGPSFQGIQELHTSKTAALSKISLNSDPAYLLPPGVLDSALQTCMCISFEQKSKALELPFSINSLNIYAPLSNEIWCHVRLSKTDGGIKEYDLDLCDYAGNVLVQIEGFVAISISGGKLTKNESIVNYYTSEWKSAKADISTQEITATDTVLVLDANADFVSEVNKANAWQVEPIQSTEPLALFEMIKAKIVSAITSKQQLNLTLIGNSNSYEKYGFIRGLIKSAQQEYQQFTGRVLALESEIFANSSQFIETVENELHVVDKEIKFEAGQRFVRSLSLISPSDNNGGLSINPNGTYLITGGVGGLGIVFAKHLAAKTSGKIILAGRSALSAEKEELVNAISNAVYMQADVTERDSVHQLIEQIKTEHGELTGVLHAAGALRDGLLIQKTTEDAAVVFGAKTSGLILLDEATKNEKLDFIFCFSSVSAILGNIGQSDYSSANAFMDDFVVYRNSLVQKGERHGSTLGVNWPLWRSGGMQIDPASEQYLKRHWGMEPLPSADGLKAFDQVLNSNNSVGVVFGDVNDLKKKFINTSVPTVKKVQSNTIEKSEDLTEKVESDIMQIAADVLKLDVAEMEADVELGDFGFDSISLTQFSNALNDEYDLNLAPTVFYNYPTIGELATFFLDEHIDWFASKSENSVVEEESDSTEDWSQPEVKQITEVFNNESANRFYKQNEKVEDSSRPVIEETEVAIVGITGRLPGANNLDAYWNNLVNKDDAITEVPQDRWDWKAYYGDPYKEKNKTKAKHGGFISDIDKFDALFFNISPHEAELMDPQQRITLEEVYHLFENAGIKPESIKGSDTGVFVGVSSTDYSTLLRKHTDVVDEAHFSTGYSHAVLANRISYLFDLHGPSEPIDTACSSSLVAIHRAVENIKSGNCTMAVAGGVNALLAPDLTLSFSQAGMLSEDGRCKTFDESANGYVRAEGVGLVLLKSLKKAKEDGDHIYGIVKGSNENHGGKANTLTSPNPKAQKELLVKAYTKAGVNPLDVSYIEAHGTGTPLGDPIETEALKLAFKEIAKKQQIELPEEAFCKLGSVKTNIGHLESAAGIAGVLKVVLGMKNDKLPGNPHLKTPNKYLELKNSPFELVKDTEPWAKNDAKPRIAGISSFGFGGTNAHIIIQEYLNQQPVQSKTEEVLICLSARTADQLQKQKDNYVSFLKENNTINLQSLAYTLHIGREEMKFRWAAKVNTIGELIACLVNHKLESGLTFEDRVQKQVSKPTKSELEGFLQERQLAELAKYWVSGTSINWVELYTKDEYSKLQLPVYPFAQKRCWIPIQKEESTSTDSLVKENSIYAKPNLHPLLHHVK